MNRSIVSLLLPAALTAALAALGAACSSDNGASGQDPWSRPDVDAETPVAGDEEAPADQDEGGGSVIIIPGDEDGTDEAETWRPECLSDRECAGDKYCDMTVNICRWRKDKCESCATSRECGTEYDACIPHASGQMVCGKYCDAETPCLTYNPQTQEWEPGAFECATIDGFTDQQCRFLPVPGGAQRGAPCCVTEDCSLDENQVQLTCWGSPRTCKRNCAEGAAACPSGMVCRSDGTCSEGCLKNGDCPTGQVCVDEECVVGECSKEQDCWPERVCDMNTLTCIPGCTTSDGCYGQNECLNLVCVERVGCKGTYNCGINENCTKEGVAMDAPPEERGVCYDPRLPASDENPMPAGVQPKNFCKACSEQAKNSAECGGAGMHCVEYRGEGGASYGTYCLISVNCKAQERDSDGNFVGWDDGDQECPRGYTCAKMNSGDLQGKYCTASCWEPDFVWPEGARR